MAADQQQRAEGDAVRRAHEDRVGVSGAQVTLDVGERHGDHGDGRDEGDLHAPEQRETHRGSGVASRLVRGRRHR
jgi:hypothetical protein